MNKVTKIKHNKDYYVGKSSSLFIIIVSSILVKVEEKKRKEKKKLCISYENRIKDLSDKIFSRLFYIIIMFRRFIIFVNIFTAICPTIAKLLHTVV